jgi:hypothetical protein
LLHEIPIKGTFALMELHFDGGEKRRKRKKVRRKELAR